MDFAIFMESASMESIRSMMSRLNGLMELKSMELECTMIFTPMHEY